MNPPLVANGSVPYSSENVYTFFTTLDGHVYAVVTGLSNTLSFYDMADLSNPVFVNSLFFDLYTDDNSSPSIGKYHSCCLLLLFVVVE